jgi:hypothetical protein
LEPCLSFLATDRARQSLPCIVITNAVNLPQQVGSILSGMPA